MLVREVMNKQVVVSKPETSLKEASKVMTDMRIGSLVVVEEEKILGILTGSDVLRAIASGKDPDRTLIENAMSKNVKTIEPDKTIEEAVDMMVEHKIKKLPVIDSGKIIGIVTASDIVVLEPKLIANVAALLSLRLPGYSGG